MRLRIICLLAGLPGLVFADVCAPLRAVNDGILAGPGPLCVAEGATLAAEGDSLTYGLDEVSGTVAAAINGSVLKRSARAYPEELGKVLGVAVENRGYPGDRAVDGLARWAKAGRADVVLVMYGTNDAGNYGGRPEGPVTLGDYRKSLAGLVARRKAQGAKVVVLAPPALESPPHERRLAAYREVAAQVARAEGVYFFDTRRALGGEGLWTDGIHLKESINRRLADTLAGYIGLVRAP